MSEFLSDAKVRALGGVLDLKERVDAKLKECNSVTEMRELAEKDKEVKALMRYATLTSFGML